MGKETPQTDDKTDDVEWEINELTASDDMCLHCFDVLLKYILKEKMTSSNLDFMHKVSPETACPLFVTWEIYIINSARKSNICDTNTSHKGMDDANEQYALRGCIGSLSPRMLKSALGEYAITSAFRDRRFQPIVLDEIPLLRVAVSLLVNYEECDHVHDWDIGKHGIIINFYAEQYDYSATFLPEVALEQGWTREKTIDSLIRKSGYRGEISNELLCEIKCTRYQSSKHKLTYSNYVSVLGHDPIQQSRTGDSHASSYHRSWKDMFHR